MDTPPGWYRDPTNPALERWWDGTVWTTTARAAHLAGGPAPTPPAFVGPGGLGAPAPDGRTRTRDIAVVVGVLVVFAALIVTVAVFRDGGSSAAVLDAARGPRASIPAAGVDFIEGNGTYAIRIGDAWDRVDTPAGEAWYTGTGSRAFRDNVTVILEDLPTTLSLDEYVELSVASAERSALSFEELDRTDIVLSDGNAALVLDYRSDQQGFALEHRLVVAVRGRLAISVTFTTEEARFAAAIAEVDAYIRSVQLR